VHQQVDQENAASTFFDWIVLRKIYIKKFFFFGSVNSR
jgi:hypothetical protein